MKILVPVDGFDILLEGGGKGLRPGQSQGSFLPGLDGGGHRDAGTGRRGYIADKMKNQAEAALAKARKLAEAQRRHWAEIDTILATGPSAADEIVQVAKDEEVGLIVIGSRGLAGKTMSFLGSTASKVVTYSPCSVMVVKD